MLTTKPMLIGRSCAANLFLISFLIPYPHFFGGPGGGVELGKVVEIGVSSFSIIVAVCVRQHESLLCRVGVRETCLTPVAECSAETFLTIIKAGA